MKKHYFLLLVIFCFTNNLAHAQAPDWLWGVNNGGKAPSSNPAITTDKQGNTYVASGFNGNFTVVGGDTLTPFGQDGLVIKYDSNGTVLWYSDIKGYESPAAVGVTTDDSDNVYVTGYTTGPIYIGTDTINTPGIYLIKYNSAGTVLWAKATSADISSFSTSIAAMGNGDFYLTGNFNTSTLMLDTITLTNSGSQDALYLAKYNSSGNIIWARTTGLYNGNSRSYSRSVCTDVAGNAYITGFYISEVSFGTDTLQGDSSFGGAAFIARYDPQGNLTWLRSSAINGGEGWGITTDPAGSVLVTGIFNFDSIAFGKDTLKPNIRFGDNMFIVKYDARGNELWARTPGGKGSNSGGLAVCTDTSGNVYVSGSFNHVVNFDCFVLASDTTAFYNGLEDIFVAKYTSDGNVFWATRLGGLGNEVGSAISRDMNNNIYIASVSGSPGFVVGADSLINASNSDLFIAKLSGYVSPTEPLNTTNPAAQSICTGFSAGLSASGTPVLEWYNSASGGTYLGGGNTFYTPALYATTTFYVQDSGCGLYFRTPVTVTVYPKPNPVITLLGPDSLGTGAFASYIWLLNGLPLLATGQTLHVTDSGQYSVVVTDANGCTDTSAAFSFSPAGINNMVAALNISVYPIPSTGLVYFKNVPANCSIEIYNVLGEQIYIAQGRSSNCAMDLGESAKGIYFYRVANSAGIIKSGRIVIE